MSNNEVIIERLNEEQKKLYLELIEWRPEYKKYCKAEISENGEYNLHIELPSPTGDDNRNILIWVHEGDISIEFGSWHAHGKAEFENVDRERGYYSEVAIIDLIKMIVSNEIVYFTEIGGDTLYPGSGILNLKYKNALSAELTDIYSSGTIDIRSWDGTQDKRITLNDIN